MAGEDCEDDERQSGIFTSPDKKIPEKRAIYAYYIQDGENSGPPMRSRTTPASSFRIVSQPFFPYSPLPSNVIFPEAVTWYIMLVLMAIERRAREALVAVRSEEEEERGGATEGGARPSCPSTTKQT